MPTDPTLIPKPSDQSASTRPPLPVPQRARWQPLRIGLVELFHYDSEEFWFHDGHLLLRGNNGTGKSKVLALTLPFLFDAQLKASRIEPDGDGGKRMAWNLLMGGRYDRRIGYAWIEFGRVDQASGEMRYLTLGAGLSAVAGRPAVDAWYFLIEGGPSTPRVNAGVWLTSPQRVTLTRERLREAIGAHGQVFESGQTYRRCVDERLFGLGETRYAALMDTLIQLRQPQLSKRPDESALSEALTEALPPLGTDLLTDVADALTQLESDRRQLEDFKALSQAVERFEQRYRDYAGTQSRRQARGLRQAQTEFDNQSRLRNDAVAAASAARAAEAAATEALAAAESAVSRSQARLEALRDDPAQQDARRLDDAARDAAQRREDVVQAETGGQAARTRLAEAESDTENSRRRVDTAGERLEAARARWSASAQTAGLAADPRSTTLLDAAPDALAILTTQGAQGVESGLNAVLVARAAQIKALQRRIAELAKAREAHRRCEDLREERKSRFDEAVQAREAADGAVEQGATAFVDRWTAHAATLTRLQLPESLPLEAVAQWARDLRGEDPLRRALNAARDGMRDTVMQERSIITIERQAAEATMMALRAEAGSLSAGSALLPPVPHTRDPEARSPAASRPGAPFWQLVEFRADLDSTQRAGLEAALEASGVLDAWVFPDGRVDDPYPVAVRHDTHWVGRKPVARGMAGQSTGNHTEGSLTSGSQAGCLTLGESGSLADYLDPDPPTDEAGRPIVSAQTIRHLLAAIAAGGDDPGPVEHWVGLDGRFRSASVAGAWSKPTATYIGLTAREAARRARLAAIAREQEALDATIERMVARLRTLELHEQEAEAEWRGAPDEQPLREAHSRAKVVASTYQQARERLAEADETLREATAVMQTCHERVLDDAEDLRLPSEPAALEAVESILGDCREIARGLTAAMQELRASWPQWQRDGAREAAARAGLADLNEQLAGRRALAEQAAERLAVLRESVGAQVEELQSKLQQARMQQTEAEEQSKRWRDDQSQAAQRRAVADSEATRSEQDLTLRAERRAAEVQRLQSFATSGLLQSALPDIELPDPAGAWTIDPALTLARRIEMLLQAVKDDDDAWQRMQRQISEARTNLHTALVALGHRADEETTDWGLIVRIVYQNRAQRPDRLLLVLADEISQRSELLAANEREILENHLQEEIAAEIQRLLREADRQLTGVNEELDKRPTSTGVRFRLRWEPLTEAEGAPPELATIRTRLANTSADLWTPEDRRRIGDMLQSRIQAEIAKDYDGGSLVEQLGRALDYRHWHRFRIERWQNGDWRKLSGPASGGERALGLTVPLFAAVASFYSRGTHAHAPRLILLDEAFVGIDTAARADCMGLINEFDLDFVLTSESEWACYAQLPGVSICHLVRRENIDGVYVSRWTWDGQQRRVDADPDRRYPPATNPAREPDSTQAPGEIE